MDNLIFMISDFSGFRFQVNPLLDPPGFSTPWSVPRHTRNLILQ
ncbi:hypothetical protein [Marinigracilibium pacificum]|nr:hypothetical protein [Marinigracilibium pacificum]